MKFTCMKQTTLNDSRLQQLQQSRRGSTLLIVIALLAMLSLLGVVFYTFASQEERSAQYFAEAAVNEADPGLDADVLFNWGLRQLIVGPDDGLYNSALHSKKHSLLSTMFGNDIHPFNGQGINVLMDSTGKIGVDQDYDGSFDGDQNLLALNYSRAAHGGTLPSILQEGNRPLPDVDYTAPDINNLFLAYNGYTLEGTTLRRVVIPSFLRPQHLRDANTGVHIPDWYENDGSIVPEKDTRTMVLRPHPAHVFVDPGGTASTTARFTSSFPFQPTTNPSGNATNHGELGIFTNSFNSGAPIVELDVDNDNDGLVEGIWMDLDFPPVENPNDPTKFILPLFSFTVYDMDGLINLNANGNMRRPDDINLNYNSSNNFFGEDDSDFTDKYLFLSRSNMGLSSPGEINPQWALNARPEKVASGGDMVDSASATSVLLQHRIFFGDYPYPYGAIGAPRTYGGAGDFKDAYESTVAWRETSNMEYFFLNFGRPEFRIPSPLANGTQSDITDLYPGRWGEPNLLYNSQRVSSSDLIYLLEQVAEPTKSFPRPGQTLVDDNGNRYEGGTLSGSLSGNRSNVHSFMHPLSHNGAGRTNKTGTNYRLPSIGYNGWKGYEDFEFAGTPRYNGGLTFFKNPINTVTAVDGSRGTLVDEADEMTVDLEKVQRPYDEPFTAADLAFLHMSQSDQDDTGINSRLENLLPFNFGRASTVNARGNSIRKTFTTMSWGRKQFSLPTIQNFRTWETGNGNEFPPFTSYPANTNPFRPALKTLLTVKFGNTTSPQLQMKLSLNELLVFDQTGTGKTVTTRTLTPHPGEDVDDDGVLDPGEDLNGNGAIDSLTSTVINTSWNGTGVNSSTANSVTYPNLPSYPPTTMEQQEFWARYDRQLKARDIYVLLYTLGGGNDALDYGGDNSANVRYSNTQMKEMAQFAVNLVDALDPDDVITRFEYDTNLGNGWDLDDNPYTTSDSDRAEVFGVEAQKLTLSEFLAIKTTKVEDSSMNEVNHDATEYNDEKARYFSFIELRNASHQTVSFANDAWQIRLEPRTDASGISGDYTNLDNLDVSHPEPTLNDTHKRRLTLRSGSVGGGGIFNIRSAGDNENTDPMTSMPRPSYFQVDPNFSGGTPAYTRIAPRDISTPAIDLITDDDTTDFLLTSEADTITPISTRGDFLNDSNTDPSGTPFGTMSFIVRLMRRAHLGRNKPSMSNAVDNADNPWVEVDSMVVTGMNEFELQESSMSATIQSQLNQLQSLEREQPLYARGAGEAKHAAGNAGTSYRANTVGTINSKTRNKYKGSDLAILQGPDGAPGITGVNDDNAGSTDDVEEAGWAFSDDRPRFDIWQPHFDRDFASKVELLSIPLVGPNRITRDLATEDGVQSRTDTSTTTIDRANDVRFAGVQKFLDPSGPEESVNTDDNRWYRLLEFVEVPTRSHRQLGNPLNDPRVPGRINLNTIRHPSVLAALLDDSDAFTMDMSGSAVHPQLDAPHLGGGNWWQEFIDSRDAKCYGIPGVTLGDEPRIPGNPKSTVTTDYPSQPFRSLHTNVPTSSSAQVRDLREKTIFRSLPYDVLNISVNNPRLLFELTSSAEHQGTAGLNNVDVHTRNRILSKIEANTTTLSNTFVVFMSVAYFEASGDGTTVYGDPVSIGERMSPEDPARTANQPDYRGFFVIDRTRAEQAFEPSTGQFDHWKRLVRYRHQVQ
ncbi:hypothetical protein [Gimesia sp.]|uniref:hypothetical protein n=1 Tax=Gimesia sp. TaxID=2024833 RepID=UPI003A932318